MNTPPPNDIPTVPTEETGTPQQPTERVATRERFQVHFNRERVVAMLANRKASTSQEPPATQQSTSQDPPATQQSTGARSPRPLGASPRLNPNSPVLKTAKRPKRRFVKRTTYDVEVQTNDYGNDSDTSSNFLF